MTYLGSLAAGWLMHEATRHHWSARRAFRAAVVVPLVTAWPAGIGVVACGWTLVLLRSRRVRSPRRPASLESDRLGQVVFVALSAGLSVAAALEFAAGEVGPAEAAEVRLVLRKARRQGLSAALTQSEGPAGRLLAVLARAQMTGASAVAAVASFVDEERKGRRSRAAEVAQRLPVKLTVPLALLILPGFVLLTFGPTVIATVQRLLGPLIS